MRGTSVVRQRLLATALVAGSVAVGSVAVVHADNPNTITLTAACDNGQTLTAELEASNGGFPSALHVVGNASVFTIHEFVITSLATGATFTSKNDSGVAQNQTLVSCTRTGQQFQFTWIGFFTPAS